MILILCATAGLPHWASMAPKQRGWLKTFFLHFYCVLTIECVFECQIAQLFRLNYRGNIYGKLFIIVFSQVVHRTAVDVPTGFYWLLRVTRDTVSGRPEDHRGCLVPVSEEACTCDDSHRLLLERLCPHRVTTVYGPFKAKVCKDS